MNREISEVRENTEKVYNVPVPSHPELIKNKEYDARAYALALLESKRGNKEQHRYINLNDFKQDTKTIASKYNISTKTLSRYIINIKKLQNVFKGTEINIVNSFATENGELYIQLMSKISSRYYVLIPSNVLYKMLVTTRRDVIKTFITLLYTLKDKNTGKYIERQVTYNYLLNKVGMSQTSTKAMCAILGLLQDMRLIQVRQVESTHYNTETLKATPKTVNMISIHPEYLQLVEDVANGYITEQVPQPDIMTAEETEEVSRQEKEFVVADMYI